MSYKMSKVFSVLGIICCAMLILGIVYDGVSSEYRETLEKVEVVDKEYNENLAMQLSTKTYPLDLFAEYNVYVLYEGEEYCIDNKELYDSVKVGDTIEVMVTKSFNKSGKLKNISIEE